MRRILTILFALIGAVNIEATERQKLNVFDKPRADKQVCLPK